MRIGILEAGAPPEPLEPRYGRYDRMVAGLIGTGHRFRTWRAMDGELPPSPDADDAYVITGSPAGVNDGLAWVDELAGFVQAARGRRPLVGICFGHQLIAHAFGGTVEKARAGWGVGLHRYDIVGDAPWLDGGGSVAAIASHQDQVTVAPPGARLIARSAFTPNAVLSYSGGEALTVQFHPEFSAAFARDLTAGMAAPGLTAEARGRAVASLADAPDTERLAGWIDRYLAGEAG